MMAPAVPTRRRGLWLAALLTLVLCGWTAWREQNDGIAAPAAGTGPRRLAPAASAASSSSSAAASSAGDLLERDPLVDAKADLFRFVSFQPPPPKVVALPAPPPPPPKPSAPPFPYKYFGRMVDIDGKTVTYLARGDALVPVQARQLLDSAYRIDAVTETQIVVTYLPLEEKITIPVQASN